MNSLYDYITTVNWGINSTNYLYETTVIGDSINSSYIPLYALFKGKILNINGKSFSIYGLINSPVNISTTSPNHAFIRQYYNLIRHLVHSIDVKFFRTRSKSSDGFTYTLYAASKGILCHIDSVTKEYKPLLSIVLRSSYLDNIKDSEDLDYNQFALVIDSSLLSPVHNIMYRNIKKLYIDPLLELGLDIVWTKDIKGWIFKTFNFSKDFTNLPELLNHLQQVNNNIFNE